MLDNGCMIVVYIVHVAAMVLLLLLVYESGYSQYMYMAGVMYMSGRHHNATVSCACQHVHVHDHT